MKTTHARTGTIEPCRDASGRLYFRGRLRLDDGSRVRIEIPEKKRFNKDSARNYVEYEQEQEDLHHTLLSAKREGLAKRAALTAGAAGETCQTWFERYCEYRRREVSTVSDDTKWWGKWIAPHLGRLAIRAITSDDIENVRDALDAAVLAYEESGRMRGEGRLAAKSARNAWTVLTTAMKYASTPKGPRELRVRQDLGNPCTDVRPPRDGAPKRRHWCRPAWIDAALASPQSDASMREAVAIGLYLHLRPGELHELRVKDIDLISGEVRIDRAFDEVKGVVKLPKTLEGIRTVTIPETLTPLLERICRERGAEDRIAPWLVNTHPDYRAALYRDFLRIGGAPEDVLRESATHEMIDFRSVRDTGITWRFLAGHRIEVVQREAGHERFETTLGYAKEVDNRQGRYGVPFAPLPPDLITGATQVAHPLAHHTSIYAKRLASRRASSPVSSRRGARTCGPCARGSSRRERRGLGT